MPSVKVYSFAGKEKGKMDLSDSIFGIEPNTSAMHLVVVNYLANQRQGTQSTLTRAEVRGGGRKPWRQKGTGHARQGSTRSPQWRHGGVALGPKPRSYGFDINKKVRKLAMKSALSDKVANDAFQIVDEFKMDAIKTKDMVAALNNSGCQEDAHRHRREGRSHLQERKKHCRRQSQPGQCHQRLRPRQCRQSRHCQGCRREA